MIFRFICTFILFNIVYSTDYFIEKFEDDTYRNRWIQSNAKSDLGKFRLSHGSFFGNAKDDLGIQTSDDARFYAISTKFKPFSNEGKTLVIQFTVKHEQQIDCGGGYLKVYPADIDQTALSGNTPYYIMFGPDICGFDVKKVHVIFTYRGKNLLTKKDIKCKDDQLTHLYTLIVNSNNTYEVRIDNDKVESGKLQEDWDFIPPKKIPDPNATKPADWIDEPQMNDPNDIKPADWDQPEYIPDPDAKKPEDWDDDIDGTWEPPSINNPKYKGIWKARQIINPNYQGPWTHPEIDNPDYFEDNNLYLFENIGAVGFDLWQVKSGTIFDNILITDSVERAREFARETWEKTTVGEKNMKDGQDAAAQKAAEAQRKMHEAAEKAKKTAAKEAEEDGDDDDDDDEEDEIASRTMPFIQKTYGVDDL